MHIIDYRTVQKLELPTPTKEVLIKLQGVPNNKIPLVTIIDSENNFIPNIELSVDRIGKDLVYKIVFENETKLSVNIIFEDYNSIIREELYSQIQIESYPKHTNGGQTVGKFTTGIRLYCPETGFEIIVTSERSMMRNRDICNKLYKEYLKEIGLGYDN